MIKFLCCADIHATSVKEITKLEKTSLSDFTLCKQSFFAPKNAKSAFFII